MILNKIPCLLLVDDDTIATFLNKSLLEKLDVFTTLDVADNGKEGLDKLINLHRINHCCPGLVLLDINMPVMDGFDFVKAFNELDIQDKKYITIVVLTSSSNMNDIKKMKELGIDHYLVKPLKQEDLISLLNELNFHH